MKKNKNKKVLVCGDLSAMTACINDPKGNIIYTSLTKKEKEAINAIVGFDYGELVKNRKGS